MNSREAAPHSLTQAVSSASDLFTKRRAGILLHPTSLPGSFNNGDLGHAAHRFIEFLAASGMCVWQMLPLGPTHVDGSPYQCLSVHAGNPQLICLDWLTDKGWLSKSSHVEPGYSSGQGSRDVCLRTAFDHFQRHADENDKGDFEAFKTTRANWLDDYALYSAIRDRYRQHPWYTWPVELRDRHPEAMQQAQKQLAAEIERVRFIQYVFFQQWLGLKRYAHDHGIWLFGDMPIFVAHDSAEVWAHREYFAVDSEGKATVVAGVPPDYFSATGQRWGNPHYDWQQLRVDRFHWWIHRMRTQLELFDLVRVDHFRGFEAYWEIPAGAETAMQGRWVKAPGRALLKALYDTFGPLPLVAEDLGIITPEVDALRRRFHLPGMTILQFAFDSSPDNPYLPHNHEERSVVYTGTHDNDTTLSWFRGLSAEQRAYVEDYFGYSIETRMPWPLIRCALASVAKLAMLPMQDVLGLGEGQRMNTPGTTQGNWQWRFQWEQVPPDLAGRLKTLLHLYGRC